MKKKVEKLIIGPENSIQDALRRIDSGTEGIVLVTDSNFVLLGTVTDGDIRRAIMNSTDLNSPVTGIMNRNPVTVTAGASRVYLENLMTSRSIRHVPVVDDRLRVTDIILMKELIEQDEEMQAVIMAGGLGTRLHAITNDKIPKPMVKVAGRPILENIITQLGAQGLDNITISVNHKKEQIEDYFRDGRKFNVNINYLEERKRLGTAGALSYLKGKMRRPFLVMNADLICNVKVQNLADFHIQSGAKLTVCSRKYQMQIPFGVINISNGTRISGIEEKPSHDFFVNAGIYLLDPDVPELIPDNTYMDMTDLIKILTDNGEHVETFPILNYWIDIGKTEDYERANKELSTQTAAT